MYQHYHASELDYLQKEVVKLGTNTDTLLMAAVTSTSVVVPVVVSLLSTVTMYRFTNPCGVVGAAHVISSVVAIGPVARRLATPVLAV